MNLGIFTYDFEHGKTQEGLMQLWLMGYQPTCILSAPWVKIKQEVPIYRVVPKGITYLHPSKIASKMNIPYHVVKHNSEKTVNLIKKYKLDIGLILGARILKKEIIDAFNIGIINLHPGILPENRGLDTLKWAFVEDLPLGVTAHLIDQKIDKGYLITQETIPVYKDDTMLDLNLRIRNKEINLIDISIKKVMAREWETKPLGKGTYHKQMPLEIEKTLPEYFEGYKKRHGI